MDSNVFCRVQAIVVPHLLTLSANCPTSELNPGHSELQNKYEVAQNRFNKENTSPLYLQAQDRVPCDALQCSLLPVAGLAVLLLMSHLNRCVEHSSQYRAAARIQVPPLLV